MRKAVCYVVMGFIGVFLTGCASVSTSRTAVYSMGSKEYSIYATGTGKLSIDIAIYINNQAVINDTLFAYNPIANFSGKYNKIKVDAECKNVNTGSDVLSRQCLVFMNGRKAADLSF